MKHVTINTYQGLGSSFQDEAQSFLQDRKRLDIDPSDIERTRAIFQDINYYKFRHVKPEQVSEVKDLETIFKARGWLTRIEAITLNQIIANNI